MRKLMIGKAIYWIRISMGFHPGEPIQRFHLVHSDLCCIILHRLALVVARRNKFQTGNFSGLSDGEWGREFSLAIQCM